MASIPYLHQTTQSSCHMFQEWSCRRLDAQKLKRSILLLTGTLRQSFAFVDCIRILAYVYKRRNEALSGGSWLIGRYLLTGWMAELSCCGLSCGSLLGLMFEYCLPLLQSNRPWNARLFYWWSFQNPFLSSLNLGIHHFRISIWQTSLSDHLP